jgi:hypothetical protein
MKADLRKLALSVHLTSPPGWIGAVIVHGLLGVAAVASRESQTVRAAWITALLGCAWRSKPRST